MTAAFALTVGCGETTYDLYEELVPGVEIATGGAQSGGSANQGGGTGGSDGSGGGTPLECQASRDASLVLVRLRGVADGRCVSQGPATVFIDSPGYETMMDTCAEDAAQYFTVRGLSDGSWELRNEGSAMNLDVNYDNTADGTPIVLFTPHRLDNQRFYIVPGSSDSFLLAPDTAPSKCVEARDGALSIWPCDAENPAQNFQQIACLDEP
jgi:hypothetical protein